jgi:hypothetical protein
MFLRCTTRKKNGKEHRYYSLVENRRVASGRVVQRHALYLGEINDTQQEAWRKTIEIFEEGKPRPRTIALYPEERIGPVQDQDIVRIRLKELSLHRPRQWGACWLAVELWEQLGLDRFWAERLPPSRKGTRWDWVLQILVTYRLLDPGSEWRLYRHWFEHSAMPDLLGADEELAEIHKLYECHEHLLTYKKELFSHLTQRWQDLFNAQFEVLLYDLTSTYFESDPPFAEGDKRRYGYSRDKRSDCVQVVVALLVTPEGFPLAYEVLAGNTSDKSTLHLVGLAQRGGELSDSPRGRFHCRASGDFDRITVGVVLHLPEQKATARVRDQHQSQQEQSREPHRHAGAVHHQHPPVVRPRTALLQPHVPGIALINQADEPRVDPANDVAGQAQWGRALRPPIACWTRPCR